MPEVAVNLSLSGCYSGWIGNLCKHKMNTHRDSSDKKLSVKISYQRFDVQRAESVSTWLPAYEINAGAIISRLKFGSNDKSIRFVYDYSCPLFSLSSSYLITLFPFNVLSFKNNFLLSVLWLNTTLTVFLFVNICVVLYNILIYLD